MLEEIGNDIQHRHFIEGRFRQLFSECIFRERFACSDELLDKRVLVRVVYTEIFASFRLTIMVSPP